MSARLTQMLDEAKRRAAGSSRPESHNLNALLLPPTQTAALCARHRDERQTLPEGEAAGYPKDIDFDALGGCAPSQRVRLPLLTFVPSVESRERRSSTCGRSSQAKSRADFTPKLSSYGRSAGPSSCPVPWARVRLCSRWCRSRLIQGAVDSFEHELPG
jgi:hypothetical protein